MKTIDNLLLFQISCVLYISYKLYNFSLPWPQESFPTLEARPYPSWIYVIIFILAGFPSLAIPVFAIFKFLQRKCCKQKDSDKTLDTISAKIQMNEKKF